MKKFILSAINEHTGLTTFIFAILTGLITTLFLTGCSTSKTHPIYGTRTSKQINTTKNPPDILETYEKEGVTTHLRNGYLVKQVVPDEIAKQLLKDANAIVSKLKRTRAPDGSIPAITQVLKQSLHNPASFQHIRTTILLIEHSYTYHVLVRIHYRATNAFGALIKTSSEFRYNTKGYLISAE